MILITTPINGNAQILKAEMADVERDFREEGLDIF